MGNNGKGQAVAGLVLGIAGLVFSFLGTWFSVLALPMSIVGLVLAVMGGKKLKAAGAPAGIATAGLVLGIIAVVFSVRLVKTRGGRIGHIIIWVVMLALLGCSGYMEYYVQRHGNQAALAYSIMSTGICIYVVLALVLRASAAKKKRISN